MKISPAVAVVVIVVLLLIVALIGWRIMAARPSATEAKEGVPTDDAALDAMYEKGGADFTKDQTEPQADTAKLNEMYEKGGADFTKQ